MPGPRDWSPRGLSGIPISCETREDRAELMNMIGIGGFCLIDGKKTELLEFQEIAGLYRFRNVGSDSEYYTGDEAFWAGLSVMKPCLE